MTKKKSTAKNDELDEVTLTIIEQGTAGARARTKRVARRGIGKLKRNQELSAKRKDAVQYRACLALMWDREQILIETGWSLQWLMSLEKYIADEDRRIWSETDARNVFATYREQQLQVARELEDLATIFRSSRQFNALVSSLRTRADVLDRIIKTGQDLGVIHKTAKQVEVTGAVDITQLTVVELRAHVKTQVAKVEELLVPVDSPRGAAGTVMKRLKAKFSGEKTPSEKIVEVLDAKRSSRKPRVKKLAGNATGKSGAQVAKDAIPST